MSEEIQSAEQRAIAAGILSNAYEGLKNFDQSLYFLRIEYDISDSLYSIEKTKTVANLASHYELSKKEAEIKMLQFEKQAQHTQLKQESRFRIMLVAFLVVVIIMLVIAVYLYQSRKKANDMLMVWSRAVDQKNQELDNLNKVKDKIFSSIAHDVRSPLASIQGLLSLMNYEILSPEELQRMTIELSAKVNTTSSLLENLLNWSRNQIATAKANPVKSDIKKLADDCIALYSSNASEKNIKLQNNIPTDSTVFVDEEMIRIVFRNLISNAIKFTPKNGEVKIEAAHQDGLLCISVSDSGVGIPEENASKIFSLEAHTTSGTANEKGTGLGLILSKEFIEKNGGEIWASSKIGKGSTFSFTVPTT
jgi:signal transduction histidine kinase